MRQPLQVAVLLRGCPGDKKATGKELFKNVRKAALVFL